jgi:hypothetical protein
MAKKIAKYTLPKTEEGLDSVATSVKGYAEVYIEGGSWSDIPAASWTVFTTAYAAWVPAYKACKVAHLPKVTEAKNLAKAALREALSDLLDRGLLLPPRTVEDAVAMGFELVDDTRTVPTEVHDSVDMDSITNGAIPGSHTHVITYRIEGSPHRAKTPYHLAVFQVYVKDTEDPEPVLNNQQGWSNDYISMTEPFEFRHEARDVGKTAYYRAHWETNGGLKGPWAMADAKVP